MDVVSSRRNMAIVCLAAVMVYSMWVLHPADKPVGAFHVSHGHDKRAASHGRAWEVRAAAETKHVQGGGAHGNKESSVTQKSVEDMASWINLRVLQRKREIEEDIGANVNATPQEEKEVELMADGVHVSDERPPDDNDDAVDDDGGQEDTLEDASDDEGDNVEGEDKTEGGVADAKDDAGANADGTAADDDGDDTTANAAGDDDDDADAESEDTEAEGTEAEDAEGGAEAEAEAEAEGEVHDEGTRTKGNRFTRAAEKKSRTKRMGAGKDDEARGAAKKKQRTRVVRAAHLISPPASATVVASPTLSRLWINVIVPHHNAHAALMRLLESCESMKGEHTRLRVVVIDFASSNAPLTTSMLGLWSLSSGVDVLLLEEEDRAYDVVRGWELGMAAVPSLDQVCVLMTVDMVVKRGEGMLQNIGQHVVFGSSVMEGFPSIETGSTYAKPGDGVGVVAMFKQDYEAVGRFPTFGEDVARAFVAQFVVGGYKVVRQQTSDVALVNAPKSSDDGDGTIVSNKRLSRARVQLGKVAQKMANMQSSEDQHVVPLDLAEADVLRAADVQSRSLDSGASVAAEAATDGGEAVAGAAVSVSVIVLLQDDYASLERCIVSLLVNQTVVDLEVVAVSLRGADSKEMQLLRLIEDDRLVLVDAPEASVPEALNAAVRASSTKYVTIVQGDAWVDAHYVEYLLRVLLEFRECMASSVGWEVLDEGRKLVVGRATPLTPAYHVFEQWVGTLQGMMLRRELFDILGGFEVSLGDAAPLDFWLRMVERYPEIPFVGSVLAHLQPRSLDQLIMLPPDPNMHERKHEAQRELMERVADRMIERTSDPQGLLNVMVFFPTVRVCTEQRQARALALSHLGMMVQLGGFERLRVDGSRYLEEALNAMPRCAEANINLARAYCIAGDWERCEKYVASLSAEPTTTTTTAATTTTTTATPAAGDKAVSHTALEYPAVLAQLQEVVLERDVREAQHLQPLISNIDNEEFMQREKLWLDTLRVRDVYKWGRPYRLGVIPSVSFATLRARGFTTDDIRAMFNPHDFFDEVYCFVPGDEGRHSAHGMQVIPAAPNRVRELVQRLQINVVRAFDTHAACGVATGTHAVAVCTAVDASKQLIHDSATKAKFVVSVSSAVTRALITRGVEPRRIYQLPQAVNEHVFHPGVRGEEDPFGRYGGKFRIVHVGPRILQKNWDTIIEALAKLDTSYVAIFVGTGGVDNLLDMAAEREVQDRVFVEDTLPQATLARFFAHADVVCLPSRWEGFPLTMLEAMATGAVVVSSDVAPITEYVTHRVNGLLVSNYEDGTALAQAIATAATDEALREVVRANAPRVVDTVGGDVVARSEVMMYRRFLRAGA